MKSKHHVLNLLSHGFKFDTVARLNESQVRVLSEKISKEENKEQVTEVPNSKTYKIGPKGGQIGGLSITQDPSTKEVMVQTKNQTVQTKSQMEEDATLDVVNDPDATEDGMGIFEKFESKSQQKLFYARCGNNKTKTEKKWCKWAKESSKKTNYETTPEKKEKNKSDKKFVEESIVRLIEKNISPKMSKGNLIRIINEKSQESSMILRKPLKNTMFSKESGIEMKRMKRPTMGMPIMGTMEENTKERESPVKDPGIKTPPKRRDNPFKNPNPGTKEKPRGQIKTKDEMKKDFIGLIKQALNK